MQRTLLIVSLAIGLVAGPAAAQKQKKKPRPPSGTPWVGVTFSGSLNYVLVEEVMPASPAAVAGLQRGDRITEFGKQPVDGRNFQTVVAARLIGDVIPVQVSRASGKSTLKLVLTAKPTPAEIMRLRFLGKPAAEFSLPIVGAAGADITLSDLRGDVVVLQYTSTSPQCTRCGSTWAALKALESSGAQVFLVATESADMCRDYVARAKPPFPLIRESNFSRSQRFLAPGLPVVVVVDRAGVIRHITDASTPAEMRELHRVTGRLQAEPVPGKK